MALIPAYQGARWIGDVVVRTRRQLSRVLVVDDGSTDATAQEAAAAGAQVIQHPHNRGKGAALRTGFAALLAAGAAGIVTLDADGQHLPEVIPRLVTPWQEGALLVLGTRAHLFEGMSRLRRLSNLLSSRAISYAAGRPLADVQTGLRIYSRELLESLELVGDRFEAESGIVVAAARAGMTIEGVPIELGFVDGRHTSHYRPIVDSLRIARAVVAARFRGSGPPAPEQRR
jgi:hypothetical protein